MPDDGLEVLDAQRDGRLGDAELLGSNPERAAFGDSDEGLELGDRVPSYWKILSIIQI